MFRETVVANPQLFVKNLNDNPPRFHEKIYSLTAPLSTRRFESVGAVTAEDPDGDRVIYRAVRRGGPFVIVPQTGEILLAEKPELRMYLLQGCDSSKFFNDFLYVRGVYFSVNFLWGKIMNQERGGGKI